MNTIDVIRRVVARLLVLQGVALVTVGYVVLAVASALDPEVTDDERP